MTNRAKPCPKCKMFYPGDCASYGCKDVENCPCDGCEIERDWMKDFDNDAWHNQ